ncbi:MAG: TonB-dependent receptor [Rubrivivax sp.]|nr:TonB-dependent receptor [Rubrivivax sp.]
MSASRTARRLSVTPVHHALAAAALALLSTGAAAQLQTITVTAERRLENIRDVPSSVSALQGEMLEVLNSGGQDIRLLAGRVPSLNIESSFGRAFPRFYIRGIGNTDFDLNASQPVSLVYDDVVQENPILKGFPIFDMERIEVLNGPQGTLFGRNSPAGVVKFESAKPGKKFEGYALASLGRFTALNFEGAVNVPLSPTVSLRVAAQSQNRDDWVKNGNPAGPTGELEGYNDNAARVQLLWSPNKDFSALFNVHTRDLSGSARVFRANIIEPGTNNLVAGFDEKKVFQDGINSQDVSSTGGSLRLRWDLGNGMALASITGYETVDSLSRGDIDGGYGASFLGAGNYGPGNIPFDAESADGLPKHKQFTQEVRLESTGTGALQWLAGVYYFDEQLKIDSFNYSSLGGNTLNGLARQDQDNKAYALFGSVNLEVSPQLKLRGGLRYTKDEKDFYADRLIAPPFSPTFIGRRTAETSATNTSGDFSVTYALDKTTNLYGRVATGFRAPAIQGRLLFGDTLSVAKSEKVTSYEAGVKADLMNGRARVSAAIFSYTIKDQQLTAVGGAANFNQLVNASKTAGQGFEFNTQWLATDNLLFTLGGSVNSTEIKDANLYVQPCGGGCTVLDPAGPVAGTVSINGNSLPQAPKQTLNFTARYSMPVSGGDLVLLADVVHRSKINFFLYESTEFTGKALTEVGVRAAYGFGNGKYEAAAFVRNLADTIRVVGGIDFNNLTGFINEPRTFGVSFKANF